MPRSSATNRKSSQTFALAISCRMAIFLTILFSAQTQHRFLGSVIGKRIKLHGLKITPEYNGKEGIIVKDSTKSSKDNRKRKITVSLDQKMKVRVPFKNVLFIEEEGDERAGGDWINDAKEGSSKFKLEPFIKGDEVRAIAGKLKDSEGVVTGISSDTFSMGKSVGVQVRAIVDFKGIGTKKISFSEIVHLDLEKERMRKERILEYLKREKRRKERQKHKKLLEKEKKARRKEKHESQKYRNPLAQFQPRPSKEDIQQQGPIGQDSIIDSDCEVLNSESEVCDDDTDCEVLPFNEKNMTLGVQKEGNNSYAKDNFGVGEWVMAIYPGNYQQHVAVVDKIIRNGTDYIVRFPAWNDHKEKVPRNFLAKMKKREKLVQNTTSPSKTSSKKNKEDYMRESFEDTARLMKDAPPLNSTNVGYQILESMGWDPKTTTKEVVDSTELPKFSFNEEFTVPKETTIEKMLGTHAPKELFPGILNDPESEGVVENSAGERIVPPHLGSQHTKSLLSFSSDFEDKEQILDMDLPLREEKKRMERRRSKLSERGKLKDYMMFDKTLLESGNIMQQFVKQQKAEKIDKIDSGKMEQQMSGEEIGKMGISQDSGLSMQPFEVPMWFRQGEGLGYLEHKHDSNPDDSDVERAMESALKKEWREYRHAQKSLGSFNDKKLWKQKQEWDKMLIEEDDKENKDRIIELRMQNIHKKLPTTHGKAMAFLRDAIGRNPMMEEIADNRKLRVLKRRLREKMRTRKEYNEAVKLIDRSANYLRFSLKQLKQRAEDEVYALQMGPNGKKIPTTEEKALAAFRKKEGKAVSKQISREERKFRERMFSKFSLDYIPDDPLENRHDLGLPPFSLRAVKNTEDAYKWSKKASKRNRLSIHAV